MRDQYAGDISDYLKFSFIHSIVPAHAHLGVVWYYVANSDKRRDGRHLEYMDEPEWSALDERIYKALKSLPARSIEALQKIDIWPDNKTFFQVSMPNKFGRGSWHKEMLEAIKHTNIVFADPDNGVSGPGKVCKKSATECEINDLASEKRTVILIRFPHRMAKHDDQLTAYHRTFAGFSPSTLRTTIRVPSKNGGTSPRIRWFTVLNGSNEINERVQVFCDRLGKIPGASAEFSK